MTPSSPPRLAASIALALALTLSAGASAASLAPSSAAPLEPAAVASTAPASTPSPPAPSRPASASPTIASDLDPSPRRRHLVFANHYGLTLGLSQLPSFDLALFFGHALPTIGGGARRWAFGYQPTLTLGGADRYLGGFVTHRHHLTALSHGGLRPRLHLALGGGLAVFNLLGPRPAVAEIEAQVGYLFGRRLHARRLAGVIGLKARLGWNAASLEKAPLPQIGAFLGFVVR